MGYRSTWKLALKAPQNQIADFKRWIDDGAGFSDEVNIDDHKAFQEVVKFFKDCLDAEVDGGIVYSHPNSKCDVYYFDELVGNIEAYAENAEPPMRFAYIRIGDDTTDRDERQSHDDFRIPWVVDVEIEWPEGLPEPKEKKGG